MAEINFIIPFNPFKPTNYNFRNLTGQIFNRLTVICLFAKTPIGGIIWLCRCSCGNFLTAEGTRITHSKLKSCGCLRAESIGNRIHGETANGKFTAEYRAYYHAKTRCNNPNFNGFQHYGGRGIKFCFNSFQDFLAEVGRKPTPQHSIERINNNGNYEKGNIRWATKQEQCRNQRRNHFLTLNGNTKTISEWAEITNSKRGRISARIITSGWCVSCAVLLSIGEICKHKIKKGL